MPPTSIGPYRVNASLGEGAFGAVYDATHKESGHRVALKLLHAASALQPDVQNRFVREIALLQRLDHQNIVRHYDCGLHDGAIYCAMEFVECGTLQNVLQQRGALPWREAADVALQVCRGLDHAHQRGCVHRDLKPANLYLTGEGIVKIGDLGLARDLDGSRLTAEGQTVGTWRYMAPEQITGANDIDGRLDLYALGCILFRMLTGRVPFDGADFVTIFDQHLGAPPPRADQSAPGIPAELADVVESMLQKSPGDRPANAGVAAKQLQRLIGGSPGAGLHEKADAELCVNEADETRPLHGAQRLRPAAGPREIRQGWRRAAIVAVAAALLVLAVFMLQSGR